MAFFRCISANSNSVLESEFGFVTSIHKDLTEKLPVINQGLAEQVRSVLDLNKSERHIRGGMATREKYLQQHLQQN